MSSPFLRTLPTLADRPFGVPLPKGQPRVVDRIQRKADLAAEERACRKAVDARDKRKCFYPRCKTTASDKHHIVPSSVRGQRRWRTDDILSACAEHHKYFKAGLIRVEGNPDKGPVKVFLTKLGVETGLRLKPAVPFITKEMPR